MVEKKSSKVMMFLIVRPVGHFPLKTEKKKLILEKLSFFSNLMQKIF